MRSEDEHMEPLEGLSYRELRLLEEMDSTPEVSQRQLAHQLGIALGVANLLVKGLAKKGYIRVSHVGWKRWVYVLTPAGVTRKVQLTLAYVDRFMDHYRRVRVSLREQLASIPLNPKSRIAIYGTSELAELAFLALRDLGVTEIEVFDRNGRRGRFLGMRVQPLASLDASMFSGVIVAMPNSLEARTRELVGVGVQPSQIVSALSDYRGLVGNGKSGNGRGKTAIPVQGQVSKVSSRNSHDDAKALVRPSDQTT